MLIALHAAVHLLAGSAYALATVPLRARASNLWRLCAALYVDLLSAAPLVAYQVRLWPAYAFGYAIDPLLSPWVESLAPLLAFGTLLAMPLVFSLGFVATQAACARNRRVLSLVPMALALAMAAALFGWHFEEFTVVGDFPTYWRGGGSAASKHLHVQILLAAYAGAIVLLWPLWRYARR